MSEVELKCPQCGATLGAQDLQLKACRFCGAMHPHVARAAEKVEIVKQMMQPGPGGIPAAMQGMVQPWQAMMPNYGAPPQQPTQYMAPGIPPQFGGPVGAPGYGPGYVPPMYGAPAGIEAARAMRRGIGAIVFVFVAVFFVIAIGFGAVMWLFMR